MTHTFTARRGAVLIGSLSAALLLGFGAASPALAHNTLIDSSPEDGAELDSAPEEVVLTFNADVGEGNNTIVVTGPDDATYEDGDVEVDGNTASVALQPLETAGEYTVGYRIVSADGHPIEEEMAFTLTEEAVPEEPAEESAQESAPADAQGSDEAEASPGDTSTADPMSAFGPVAGVVGGIAILALVIILIVRMRNRPGGSDGA
ncbi:MAG: copper resistance protein CopC [Nocardiopsaceae bacterium]|nr:copper resistance protein CopC [Nocardiopsaceae bacterium]